MIDRSQRRPIIRQRFELRVLDMGMGTHTTFPHRASQPLLSAARPYFAGSVLMLPALMIGHHFSISALWKARNASAVC